MPGKRSRKVPLALSRGAQRFAQWRGKRKIGARIPERLWAMAVKLAVAHGLNRTASALAVDYYTLKRRVDEAGNKSASTQPSLQGSSFVELSLPAGSGPGGECVIELENAVGSRMRMHVTGAHSPDLVALSRSFWDAE